jgi:hypothetical protein
MTISSRILLLNRMREMLDDAHLINQLPRLFATPVNSVHPLTLLCMHPNTISLELLGICVPCTNIGGSSFPITVVDLHT